jgi:hypothetical protein
VNRIRNLTEFLACVQDAHDQKLKEGFLAGLEFTRLLARYWAAQQPEVLGGPAPAQEPPPVDDAYTSAGDLLRVVPARVWGDGRSWTYRSTFNAGGVALRVTIRRAGDDDPFARVEGYSFATVEAFSPSTHSWNGVADRPIKECRCQAVSPSATSVTTEDFAADVRALLGEALAVLAASGVTGGA